MILRITVIILATYYLNSHNLHENFLNQAESERQINFIFTNYVQQLNNILPISLKAIIFKIITKYEIKIMKMKNKIKKVL